MLSTVKITDKRHAKGCEDPPFTMFIDDEEITGVTSYSVTSSGPYDLVRVNATILCRDVVLDVDTDDANIHITPQNKEGA